MGIIVLIARIPFDKFIFIFKYQNVLNLQPSILSLIIPIGDQQ